MAWSRRSRRPRPARASLSRRDVLIEHLDGRLLLCGLSHGVTATPALLATPSTITVTAANVVSRAAAASVPSTGVPLLHSRASAAVKLFLDFDGDDSPSWGSFRPGVTPAYSVDGDPTTFDEAELANVREVWARVADSFSPFNVDVTTQDPGNADDLKTVRVVIGGGGAWYSDGFYGGLAYVGGFASGDPNTVFVFSENLTNGYPAYVASAAAHEIGHSLGLSHQSTYTGSTKDGEYSSGTPLTAPIMGAAYYSARVLWWAGTPDYSATVTQDDLAILASNVNGFGYRADDRGNAAAQAATLALGSTVTGVVERTDDVDYFKFTTPGGYVTIAGGVPELSRMLDPIVELRDAAGNVIASGDGAFVTNGPYPGDLITRKVAAGTYYVSVRGHGLVSTAEQGVDAKFGRFSDVGQYTLTATVSATPPQQAYPAPSTPFAIRATGDSVLQAEDFDTGGEGVAYHDVDAANVGGKYRTDEGVDVESTADAGGGFAIGYAKPGEWVEYTIDVDQFGTYQVALRLAAQQAGAAMHLELDGQNLTGALAVPSTGGWQKWQTLTKTDLWLTAGRHVLRVAFDKAGPTGFVANLNSLAFSPYVYVPPTQTPYGGSPFSVGQTIEAEDYDIGGEGVAYHDRDAVNSGGYRPIEGVDTEATTDAGGGYDVGFVRAGEWLEYTVNVATPGRYDLSLRLANVAAGATFHVEFDGLNATGPISVPNTGGYQKWQTVARTVQVVGGVQVMRVVFDTAAPTGYAGNFNWAKLTPAAPAPRIVVQAEDYLAGGDGVGYHDTDAVNSGGKYRPGEGVDVETTTDAGGGFNVGYARAGEWLKYGFDVTAAGIYRVDFRVAAVLPGGRFHFEVDGVPEPGFLSVPATGGYQSWQTVTAPSVTLTTGHHTLRIVMDQSASSGFVGNFNWIALTQLA